MRITVVRKGKEYGPYAEKIIRQYLAENSLRPDDMARIAETDDAWQPLAELMNLNALMPASVDAAESAVVPLIKTSIEAVADIDPSVLPITARLCDYVEKKTRFSRADLKLGAEVHEQSSFDVVSRYAFQSTPTSESINGHFVLSDVDVSCDSPILGARSDVSARLSLAKQKLSEALRDPSREWNAIASGLWLPHVRKHWHLDTCGSCDGAGRNKCTTCSGKGDVTCHRCSGGLFVTCDQWGCFGGKINCSSCGGTGQVAHQVTYTTWANGVAHNDYRTEYRSCTAFGCLFGKVQCPKCSGTSRINCPSCYATGRVTCSTCGGGGYVRCNPCDGSGRVGDAAWVDVGITVTHELVFPTDTPADVISIGEKEGGAEGIVPLLSSFGLREICAEDDQDIVRYSAILGVDRLAVSCLDKEFRIVAYGNNQRWLTLDNMIESLLGADLDALSRAVAASAEEGMFSVKFEPLLEPLGKVIASEVNADMIEASLDSKNPESCDHGAVSGEYVEKVKEAVLTALKSVVLRHAKGISWKLGLSSLIASLVGWVFWGAEMGGLIGLIVAGSGEVFARLNRKKLLGDSPDIGPHVDRLLGLVQKSKIQLQATAITVTPAVLAALCAHWLLPMRGYF
jgi:hypothetical protein